MEKESQKYTNKIKETLAAKAAQCTEKDKLGKLMKILNGELTDKLYLQFLKKNNHTDMLLINQIKDSIGTKNSMLHSATVWCNGVMNAYTTNDAFLRDNISWAGNATNWNRFMVTSTLGMIHMGNKSQAEEILNPYFAGAAGGGG